MHKIQIARAGAWESQTSERIHRYAGRSEKGNRKKIGWQKQSVGITGIRIKPSPLNKTQETFE